MKPLKGKIALVTGGSRGAGRAIAVELGKAGATVYMTAPYIVDQDIQFSLFFANFSDDSLCF